jgi:hypothetical protein
MGWKSFIKWLGGIIILGLAIVGALSLLGSGAFG